MRLPGLGVVCWLVGGVAEVASDLMDFMVAIVLGRWWLLYHVEVVREKRKTVIGITVGFVFLGFLFVGVNHGLLWRMIGVVCGYNIG
jgi:hypothetical protein